MTVSEFDYIKHTIPNHAGIYKFVDKDDKILYIGKAKALRKRVTSYFKRGKYDSARLILLTRKIHHIDFTIVNSEQDALLLEDQLVKEHQPKYNVQLKDDKSFPFIRIKKEHFPRVFLTRRKILDGSTYFGPYTSVKRTREILDLIKTLFQLRNCNFYLSPKNIENKKFKVCLEYHIGNCNAPCIGLEKEDEYQENIQQIKHILKGHLKPVVNFLKEQMDGYARAYEYEKANEIKEKLDYLQKYQSKSTIVNPSISGAEVYNLISDNEKYFVNYLKIVEGSIVQTRALELKSKLGESKEEILAIAIRRFRKDSLDQSNEIIIPFSVDMDLPEILVTVPQRGDKKQLLEFALKNAIYQKNKRLLQKTNVGSVANIEVLEQMKKDFRLTGLPYHIECFDNSNIQGDNPVASLVVFKNSKPSKKDYRHFKIKTVTGPDDYASMEEVVFRRYKRLLEENEPLPDLIVIDGGKGQLNAAAKSLRSLDILNRITLVSIAKKLEEIYYLNDPIPLHIEKRSQSLKIIQQLRNEAHRFAISFHRSKRIKGKLKTELHDITGIGDHTSKKLLSSFKSIKKIRQASLEELALVIGDSKAKLIANYFSTTKDRAQS